MTTENFSWLIQNLIFSLERVAVRLKSMISGSRGFSKKIIGRRKCYVCVANFFAAMTTSQTRSSSAKKSLNKRVLEDSRNGPMAKHKIVLDEEVDLTSTDRGFRTINHMVATYEQTKKGLSYFYPKRQVKDDGIHTKPLNL